MHIHVAIIIIAVGICPELTAPDNGSVSYPNTQPGSTVTYTCHSGYELSGVLSRTCQSDGTWSNTAPTCIRMHSCM